MKPKTSASSALALLAVFAVAGPVIGTAFAAATSGLAAMIDAEGSAAVQSWLFIFQMGYLVGLVPALAAGAAVAAVHALIGRVAALVAAAPAGAGATLLVARVWRGLASATPADAGFGPLEGGLRVFVASGAVAAVACVVIAVVLDGAARRRLRASG